MTKELDMTLNQICIDDEATETKRVAVATIKIATVVPRQSLTVPVTLPPQTARKLNDKTRMALVKVRAETVTKTGDVRVVTATGTGRRDIRTNESVVIVGIDIGINTGVGVGTDIGTDIGIEAGVGTDTGTAVTVGKDIGGEAIVGIDIGTEATVQTDTETEVTVGTDIETANIDGSHVGAGVRVETEKSVDVGTMIGTS